jgi:Zn-finger nucleic acid-binding protein
MIVLEIDQVEVDHCLQCKGTWLDAGELELLLGGAENKEHLLASMDTNAPTKEAVRRCPICRKKMSKVLCGSHEQIIIDKCKKNDGLWFDEGELKEIIAMGDFPGEHQVYELLNDVVGNKR